MGLTSREHNRILPGRINRNEVIEGFRYHRTDVKSVRFGSRIRQVIESEQPDVLHVHSPVRNASPALRIAGSARIPVIYEIRAFWEDAIVDHGIYEEDSPEYESMRSMETRVCRKVNQVAVICRGLKDDLLKRGIHSTNLTVVPNGVSFDDFNACTPDIEYRRMWKLDGRKVIGFIGSFFPYEGLDLLVEAMARLVKVRSDVVLLLVGGGRMEAVLKDKIKRLHLENMVITPGRIPHDRIPGVYALMDILVYPRHSIRLTELTTPLKPLEAMAMNKAVVASDIGGHQELIQNECTGLLCAAGDVSALTATIVRLLDNPHLREKLAEEAAAWVRRERSWDRTTEAYSDIYARALERPLQTGRTLSETVEAPFIE